MGRSKPEHPPLFPAGFRDLADQSEFEALFVDPFERRARRSHLVGRLRSLLAHVGEQVPVQWEVWIDGSFCTSEPDPSDVDLVFRYSSQELDALGGEIKERARVFATPALQMTFKMRYECDCFFIARENLTDRSYWLGGFGFARNDIPKGIPRLWLNRAP